MGTKVCYRRSKSAENAILSYQGYKKTCAVRFEEQVTLIALDLDMNGEANSEKAVCYNNYNRSFLKTKMFFCLINVWHTCF